MQQKPTNFFERTQKYSTQEAYLEELSHASLERRIHLPEAQSRQVLPAEMSSFARVRQVQSSSFSDSRYSFRTYAFAVAQMVCGDLLDGCEQGRDFGTTSFQDDQCFLAYRLSNVEDFVLVHGGPKPRLWA